jgi:RimJ/RimL family protein N-acetyltransferase
MIERDAPSGERDAARDARGRRDLGEAAIDREVLVGGVNEVIREGGTVRRPAGPWSGTVQRLLVHLAETGFDGAPRALGLSADGREELVEFLPGEIGHDFAAPEVRSDASLEAAARLLRRLHDASATFPRTDADLWYLPVREPAEVICHGDAATYNTVFRDGLPVAFIDFDTAHPAPRVWDAAYTAYRFVPLYAPDEAELTLPAGEARRRLALFGRAYGLSEDERDALASVAAERLRAHVALMREQAAAGHAAFAGHLAEGHDQRYLTDAEWISRVYGGVLRTARLTLRPARPEDDAWLLEHWTEADVRRFLYDGEVLTSDQVAAEIAQSRRGFAADGYGLWLVECAEPAGGAEPAEPAEAGERGGTALLGTIGIRPLEDLGLELYYSLAPAAWGNGYATEAAQAVVEHALGPLGLPELLAEIDEGNRASAGVLGRLGMEPFDLVPGVLGPMTRYRTVGR